MKLKTTIILLIVAAIGFAYVFLIEKKQFTTDQVAQRSWLVFPDFQPEKFSRIEIKKGDQVTLLEKTGDGDWMLREPISVKAEKTEVDSILSELKYLKKIGTIDDVTDLKPYGLAEPAYIATLWAEGAGQGANAYTTINVGSKRAGGEEVYIKINDRTDTLLVSGKILDKIGKSTTDLRNKSVFDVETAGVERLELHYASGETIVCVRKGDDWYLEEPVSDLCDNKRVVEIINKLKALKIAPEDFISEDDSNLSKYGLDMPQITVAVEQDNKTHKAILGHTLDDKVYAKHEDAPSIFMLSDKTLSGLTVKTSDLRSRSLCRFDQLFVNKAIIKSGGADVVVEKTKEYDWRITTPVDIFADAETFKNLLTTIQEMEIQNFVADNPEDMSKWKLDVPVADIELFKEGGESVAHIHVGIKDEMGKLCYVKRAGENSVYMVKVDGFYDTVTSPLLALRDKLLIDYEKENVERIVVKKKDRSFVCEKDKDDPSKWMLLEPVKTAADMIPMNNIIWGLAFFKADKYVEESPKDLSVYGLDDPAIKITVTYKETVEATAEERKKDFQGDIYLNPQVSEGPPVTKTLLIGNKVEQKEDANYYAILEGGNFVFEASWTDVNDFNAELAPTRILPFNKANVIALDMVYNDQEIAYEFTREEWQMLKPEKRDGVDRREVEVITYHLENLRAEAIELYHTDSLAQFGLDNPWFRATVNTVGGEFILYVGNKTGDNKYYAKSAQSDFIYVVKGEDIDLLMGIEQEENL